jgi:hypothetical protein
MGTILEPARKVRRQNRSGLQSDRSTEKWNIEET